MSNTTHYTVTGMTCGHCATAVSTEVAEIPGVLDADVDLGTGDLTITSDRPLDDEAVRSAVDDAGYSAAPA